MMKKLFLNTLTISLFFTSSLVMSEELKNELKNVNGLENIQKILFEDKEKTYQDLSKQVAKLEEKLDKNKNILSSNNQSVLFYSNVFKNKNLNISTFSSQKSITYNLKINLEEGTLYFNSLFENNTINEQVFQNFRPLFSCYLEKEDVCKLKYQILYENNNQIKQGEFDFYKVIDKEGKFETEYNKLIFSDKSFNELLNILDEKGEKTLIIKTNEVPFNENTYFFNLMNK